VAEKFGLERTRNRYLRDFVRFAAPISCHAESAYLSQGLWRGLVSLAHILRMIRNPCRFSKQFRKCNSATLNNDSPMKTQRLGGA
jgi:hypothetical protein